MGIGAVRPCQAEPMRTQVRNMRAAKVHAHVLVGTQAKTIGVVRTDWPEEMLIAIGAVPLCQADKTRLHMKTIGARKVGPTQIGIDAATFYQADISRKWLKTIGGAQARKRSATMLLMRMSGAVGEPRARMKAISLGGRGATARSN